MGGGDALRGVHERWQIDADRTRDNVPLIILSIVLTSQILVLKKTRVVLVAVFVRTLLAALASLARHSDRPVQVHEHRRCPSISQLHDHSSTKHTVAGLGGQTQRVTWSYRDCLSDSGGPTSRTKTITAVPVGATPSFIK